jgi:site-specific recombinase XerD
MTRVFLENLSCGDFRIFSSINREKFTGPGITKILKRHFAAAREINPAVLFPEEIHPHALRASKAIHLLESGVHLIAIRDFLGHASVSTTQIYLRVNSQAKRDAIARACPSPVGPAPPPWRENSDLMLLLKELCS